MSFERFDALLGFWLDVEGRLTISYEQLKKEMRNNDCNVGCDITWWNRTLLLIEPPLENIATLLSDRLFINAFFPKTSEGYLKRMAFDMDHAKMLSLFLGDDVQDTFFEACRHRKKEIVKMLLEDGRADPTARSNEAIKWVAHSGYDEIVELLLKDGRANPVVGDNSPLRWASERGHAKVVELLLKDGRADPKACDKHVIRVASWYGHHAVLELPRKDGRVLD